MLSHACTYNAVSWGLDANLNWLLDNAPAAAAPGQPAIESSQPGYCCLRVTVMTEHNLNFLLEVRFVQNLKDGIAWASWPLFMSCRFGSKIIAPWHKNFKFSYLAIQNWIHVLLPPKSSCVHFKSFDQVHYSLIATIILRCIMLVLRRLDHQAQRFLFVALDYFVQDNVRFISF